MKCIGLIIGCLCFFIITNVTEAAGYKVTPRVIDKEVKTRDIFTEIVTLENFSGAKLTIYPAVNAITLDAGGDIEAFVDLVELENKANSITAWIQMSRAPIELMPGEVVELPVVFKINAEAEGGNYQALLSFGSGGNRSAAEAAVRANEAPGVIVTLAVDQNQTEFLRLGKFVVDKFVTSPDNQAISYTLSNPGEADVIPTGEVIIYNGRGTEVGSVPVNPDGVVLAAGENREMTATAPLAGYLGKYKAFLSIDYGTEQVASVYDTTFYYVLPWQKLLLTFGIVLVVVLVLVIWLSRKFGSAHEEEDGTGYLPVHVYEGVSKNVDHDINLKQ